MGGKPLMCCLDCRHMFLRRHSAWRQLKHTRKQSGLERNSPPAALAHEASTLTRCWLSLFSRLAAAATAATGQSPGSAASPSELQPPSLPSDSLH
jgi:hypothetical protein